MIEVNIPSRFTGNAIFTDEIDCAENESWATKLGMAVELAVKKGANLSGANLYRANLRWANLYRANLEEANLRWADLEGANLEEANLSGADLRWANLRGANLYRANLSRADLSRADLRGANLSGANLEGANLYRADLRGVSGVNDYIKCIQIDQYPITYTSDVLQIGCERHGIDEWRGFDDRTIAEMDGKCALKFWRRYKDWIFKTIELCPAKPTKEIEQ